MDDVLDGINEFTYLLENLVVRDLRSGVKGFVTTIVDVTAAVEIATGEFAKFKTSKTLKEHVKAVKMLEKGTDRLYSEMTKTLYTHEKIPLKSSNGATSSINSKKLSMMLKAVSK